MLLDLVKLFPENFQRSDNKVLRVESDNIKSYGRLVDANSKKRHDIIEMQDGTIYKFEPTDRGIFLINAIKTAQEVLLEFEQAKSEILGVSKHRLEKRKLRALNFLQEVNVLYT